MAFEQTWIFKALSKIGIAASEIIEAETNATQPDLAT